MASSAVALVMIGLANEAANAVRTRSPQPSDFKENKKIIFLAKEAVKAAKKLKHTILGGLDTGGNMHECRTAALKLHRALHIYRALLIYRARVFGSLKVPVGSIIACK